MTRHADLQEVAPRLPRERMRPNVEELDASLRKHAQNLGQGAGVAWTLKRTLVTSRPVRPVGRVPITA